MNTLNNITTKVIVCFLILFISCSAFAKSPFNAELIKRIENLNTVIDIRVTDEVLTQVKSRMEDWRNDSETLLGRTTLYFPYIEKLLREKDLPDDLKYIAVIESGLLLDVKSRQGAAGMWQFMDNTAELFGLKNNKYIDERKDFVKSTEKALDYMQLLYETYGNWTLALAAYNCGTGRINKAIKDANGSKNYWEVAQYLPTETKKYIPRFIGAMYLMNYYYLHDLNPKEPSEDIKFISSVQVVEKTDFKKLAKALDMDYDLLRFLNPIYKKHYIPEADENESYILTLPDTKMLVYLDKYDNNRNLVYNPIAQKRPVTEDALVSAPRTLTEYAQFLIRDNLMVRDNLKDTSFMRNLVNGILPSREKIRFYQLRKKESLADVALANNIPLAELMALNNIDESIGIPPGSTILLSR
jgi:membrane-bound lytic murein transglycosylase D